MKTFKFIITNLIMVLALVILTSGTALASVWDVNIDVKRDGENNIKSIELQLIRDFEKVSIDELYYVDERGNTPSVQITLKDKNDPEKRGIHFGINMPKLPEGKTLKDVEDDIHYFFDFYDDLDQSDVMFDYDIDSKTIIITPVNTVYLGKKVDLFRIEIKEPTGKVGANDYQKTTLVKFPATTMNVDFSMFYSFDGNIKYYIIIDGATFGTLGNIGIYHGDSKEISETFGSYEYYFPLTNKDYYSPGQTLTIKHVDTGREYGSVTIERITSLDFEPANTESEKAEIICKANGTDTISFSRLKDFGWKTLNIENIVTKEKFSVDLTSLTFTNGSGEFSADGTTMILPEKGAYRLWVNNPYDGKNAIDRTVYAINKNAFDVTLEVDKEEVKYKLVFTDTIENLKKKNGNKNFKIVIEDKASGKQIGSLDSYGKFWGFLWHTAINDNVLSIDKQEIYLYEKIKVTFVQADDETDIINEVTLDVPKIDTVENLTAKIVAPGTIEIYGSTGNALSQKQLITILQIPSSGWPYYKLYYKPSSTVVLETIDEYSYIKDNDTQYVFEIFEQFKRSYGDITSEEDLLGLDHIELQALINSTKEILDYYNVVKNNGDKELFVDLRKGDGSSVKIKLEKNKDTYFEAITGLTIEDCGIIMAAIQASINEHATEVKNGILEITADESYKDFYLPDSGIYYVYIENKLGGSDGIPSISITNYVVDEYKRIMFAGKLTGEQDDEGKNLGLYVNYDMNTGNVTTINKVSEANCYPLIGGKIYRLRNYSDTYFTLADRDMTVKFIKLDIAGDGNESELVEIYDETADAYGLESQNNRYGDIVKVAWITTKSTSMFESLSGMMAKFVRTLANGLNYLVQMSLQIVGNEAANQSIDIDSLIFNHYPDTSIAFFKSNKGGDNPSKMISMFRDGINKWYSVFTGIAIAGYILILLYIGIRILLNVGGSKQAQYKELLTHWAVGLVILVFFPYVIRYAIEINNVFVGMVEKSKAGMLGIEDVSANVDMSDFSLPVVSDDDDYRAYAQQMDENPFSSSDTSYMAVMANKAHTSGSLVDAVVYLIMVWQFIIIVIMYYKRVFTIAFLIAIFPFVTLSYAIDKVADGKAQAFSVWTREIMSNIFIQSIHAVVYVFVIGATYVDGEYNGDWLLSIIGITFLFNGEQLLKKFVGQGGESTVKSLGDTAKKTVATVGAIKVASSAIADNVVGAKSHLGSAASMYRQWQTEKKTARNMDFFNQNKPAFSMPAGSELGSQFYNPAMAGNQEYDDLANDIQTLNNRENVDDPEALSNALKNVMAHQGSTDPEIQRLMGGLNLSDEQLNALSRLQDDAVTEWVDGDRSTPEKAKELREKIDAEVEAKLKIIFPGAREKQDVLKRAFYKNLKDADKDKKHKQRSTDRMEVRKEYAQAENRRKTFFNPKVVKDNGIGNPFSEATGPSDLSSFASSKKSSIVSTFYRGNATEDEQRMAEYLAILKEFSNLNYARGGNNPHKYTPKQVMQAAKFVAAHQNDSKRNKRAVMATLGLSGDEAKAIVAEEIGRRYTDVSTTNNFDFRTDVAKGAGAKVETPRNGTEREKRKAVADTKEAWQMAMDEIAADDARSERDRIDARKNAFFDADRARRKGYANPFSERTTPSDLSRKAEASKQRIMTRYFGSVNNSGIINRDKMAESLAILEEFSGAAKLNGAPVETYTPLQVMEAANYVAKHEGKSKGTRSAVIDMFGMDGGNVREVVAREICRQYSDRTGIDTEDFVGRDGARSTIDSSDKDRIKAWKMAVEVVDEANAEKFQRNDETDISRYCYQESLDRVSVKDILRKERDYQYDRDTHIDYIIEERERQNEREVVLVENFARAQLDSLPEIDREVRFDGLTQKEHEQYAEDLKKKFAEELLRTGATTTGVILGGAIGAGVNIGLNDSNSAVKEAFAGAVVGLKAGDEMAERAIGRTEKTKKVRILNPYTGRVEEFELQKEGFTKESTWETLVDNEDILRYDDTRLADIYYKLDAQFIEHKREATKKAESERKRTLYDDALRNNRRNS